MADQLSPPLPEQQKSGFSAKQVLIIVIVSMAIAIIVTAIAIKLLLFPSPFKPVTLSAKEEAVLNAKLETFEGFSTEPVIEDKDYDSEGKIIPEKYSEEGLSREIHFTERELNSMIAKNTDLADKVAIDLSKDMVSVKILIPLDPDFPIMGGKTLKIKAGAELAYRNARPVVKLRGVSVMGVPMPNDWLGGIKNIDLISEFGSDDGFWNSFANGVKSVGVVDGSLKIELNE